MSIKCRLKEHKNYPHDPNTLVVTAETKEGSTIEWWLTRYQANKFDDDLMDALEAAAAENKWPTADKDGIRINLGPFSDVWLKEDRVHFATGKDIVANTTIFTKDSRKLARNIIKFVTKKFQGLDRFR
jgi:hypothetical protein